MPQPICASAAKPPPTNNWPLEDGEPRQTVRDYLRDLYQYYGGPRYRPEEIRDFNAFVKAEANADFLLKTWLGHQPGTVRTYPVAYLGMCLRDALEPDDAIYAEYETSLRQQS